ncbi:hypothetical protein [Kitasatospora sp. NPDC051914]|uniref:WXG100-like domain-containing protein n=1 Tax=Kitasatospora sp. NPDC051914 TaxID=3154945 RepID=UPI003427406C
MKIELPADLEDVLKTLQSNDEGKDVLFPDGNEERINDLAAAWAEFNEIADARIRTICGHAQEAFAHMSGEAADAYQRYLEKYAAGENSHAGTVLTAGKMVEVHLRGAATAITETKNEMINQLEYAKKYIEENPAGKNDDIAQSEGIDSAVELYHGYVKGVTGGVDTMLRRGADHSAATEAATQVCDLTEKKVPGGGTAPPPGTGINSLTPPPPGLGDTGTGGGGTESGGPGGGGPGGGGPGGGGPGGAGGGAGGGQPSKAGNIKPYRPPQVKNPHLGGGLGPDGKPLFKPAVQPPGLSLAGHPAFRGGSGDAAGLSPWSGGGAGGGSGSGGGGGYSPGVPGAFGGLSGAAGYGRGAGTVGGTGATGAAAGRAGGTAAAGTTAGAAGRGAMGMPGAGMMGGGAGGAGGGRGGTGNRFVRPTRFGGKEEKDDRRRGADTGILGGDQVEHQQVNPYFERMRRQWLDEARGSSPGEGPAAAAATAAAQPAAAGGDLMTQLAGALLGTGTSPEDTAGAAAGTGAATTAAATGGDTPAAAGPAATGTAGETRQAAAATGGRDAPTEDAYLERARSAAERRGRPDAEAPGAAAASAGGGAGGGAATGGAPAPIRQEGGYDVPSPFLRAALVRIAGTSAEGAPRT